MAAARRKAAAAKKLRPGWWSGPRGPSSAALEETVAGIGRSEALPNRLVTLTPAMQGQVASIEANLGDTLDQGDLVVELEPALAKADVAEKKANRDTLQAALDLLTAEPRPEERKGLEIAIDQARSAVARAQDSLDRLRPLVARKEASAAQMFDAEQLLVRAQLGQKSAEAQLALLLAGPRPEAVAESKARLGAAEEALKLAQEHLALHSIRSPIDGVLDSLTCHPGQTVAAGLAIGEIVQASQVNVVVWLPPLVASKVAVGQTARLEIGGVGSKPAAAANEQDQHESGESTEAAERSSRPADGSAAEHQAGSAAEHNEASENETDEDAPPAIEGKVASVGRIVDVQTGNLPIRLLVDNADGRIAVGQTLPVTIVIHEHADELVVPSTALVDLGEGPMIMVVRQGKVVPLQPTAVATHGMWTIVLGTDLQVGEEVVIDGGFNLPEGTRVNIEGKEPAEGETPAVAEARP